MNLRRWTAVPFTALITVLIWEVVCRVYGVQPVSKSIDSFVMQEPWQEDPFLGYSNREGSFVKRRPDSTEVTYTINSNGIRVDPLYLPSPNERLKSQALFVGDSYTFGVLVNDHETLPATFQKMRSDLVVVNYGVGGYNLCQIYLSSLKYIANSNIKPSYVVYSYIGIHDYRGLSNISELWRSAYNYPGYSTFVPTCRVTESENILRQDPPRLIPIFGSTLPYSSLVVFLNDLWFRFRYRLEPSEVRLNQSIIHSWNKELEKSKIKLIILLLDLPSDRKEEIESYLNNERITFLDLSISDSYEQIYRISGDGHPSAQLYLRWAEYLAKNWDR